MPAKKRGRSLTQAVMSGLLLILGLGGGVLLTKSALGAPVPGADPTGTPLADASSVVLPTGFDAKPIDGPTTLVVYEADFSGPGAVPHSEMLAIAMANLAGHFGPVTTMAVEDYNSDDGLDYDGVVYASAHGVAPINAQFLGDVIALKFPVMWIGEGFSQLVDADPEFFETIGWSAADDALLDPVSVTYKGTEFDRNDRAAPTFEVDVLDATKSTVLATTTLPDGSEDVYAIRHENLTYIAEVPFDYLVEGNHSLVVADLLFDLVEPDRDERHRGMVRLEDVGPYADPGSLIAIADALHARDIPFSVAVYSIWRDPQGQYGWGTDIRLSDRPDVVEALKYMESKGGTLLMHGVTHQYGETPNPYEGTSGEDFEFYKAYLDDHNNVVTQGPLDVDSVEWMTERIRQGFAEIADAGLSTPTIFEFPHYAGSPTSYEVVAPMFEARYEQTAYFAGMLTGGELDTDSMRTQYMPYPVFDLYGEYLIPENLGNVIPLGFNNNRSRSPQDIVHSAEKSLVVRDNIASFFFHPFLDIELLLEIVDGMTELGYEFVSPQEVLDDWK